ncbi:MAG: hypothetical protein B7X00_00125 [Legionella sp. 21-45-4]|nr:MAG: hypothetical protein B7X00_00125 [Legionella sp. 21-45-4]
MSLICFSLTCGYFIANFYDYQHLRTWIEETVFSKVSPKAPKQSHPVVTKESHHPEPKFEFYTLLTQNKSQKPQSTAPETTSPEIHEATSVERYVLQLASFRRTEDAERLKASLILNGFKVTVVSVQQQQVTWYRVVSEPFTSRSDAMVMQGAVARSQRITGIVRKMDT